MNNKYERLGDLLVFFSAMWLWTFSVLTIVWLVATIAPPFLSGSPGDFPWEDVIALEPAVDVAYAVSDAFEYGRDINLTVINGYRYMSVVVDEGDYQNDWLTHIPGKYNQQFLNLGLTFTAMTN